MTIIFTIIDEKVKTEFVGMRYEFKELNYSQPTIITNDVDMVNLFPITQFDSGKMKNIANLLNSTISRISLMHLSMVKYVSSKDEDYKF